MGEVFVGQNNVRKSLQKSILSGTVSHAYIFEGPAGIGKKTLAKQFAAAIHCEENKGTPCGTCHACMMHKAMSHPDYQIFEEKEKASQGIEDIRRLIEDAYLRPMIADKKVYLLPRADMLTVQAQNALLKVFEEPPGDSIILLVSENSENLLSTIRSRARQVVFERHSEAEIASYLREEYPEKEAQIPFISRFSDGRIGEAKKMMEDEAFLENRRTFFELIQKMGDRESSIYEVRDFLVAHKEKRAEYIDLMLTFFRDCLRLKMGVGNLLNEDFLKEITEFSEKTTAHGLSRAADAVILTVTNMGKQSNPDIWFLEMLLNCWRELHGTSHWSSVS